MASQYMVNIVFTLLTCFFIAAVRLSTACCPPSTRNAKAPPVHARSLPGLFPLSPYVCNVKKPAVSKLGGVTMKFVVLPFLMVSFIVCSCVIWVLERIPRL